MYDKLVTKVNAIVTKVQSVSGLVSKTHYDSNKQNLEKKIENFNKKILNTIGTEKTILCISDLVSTTVLSAKATEIENEIPDITVLAIKAAFKGTWGKRTSFFLK